MHHKSPVTLRKVFPEANMHRQYTVTVTSDLFGTPLVICRWGRIGTAGRVREYPCATVQEAEKMAARLLDAKRKRGYGAGKSTTAARPARVRKPAARLRRAISGPKQFWLPGIEAFPGHRVPPPPTKPAAKPLKQMLPSHLTDLAAVTAQRRGPLDDADRTRRLSMAVDFIRAQGMPVRWGGAHSR